MKTKKSETSPIGSLCTELNAIEKAFHETLRAYTKRIDTDLNHIRHAVESLEAQPKLEKIHLHDVRDMLMLARNLERGRRVDVMILARLRK